MTLGKFLSDNASLDDYDVMLTTSPREYALNARKFRENLRGIVSKQMLGSNLLKIIQQAIKNFVADVKAKLGNKANPFSEARKERIKQSIFSQYREQVKTFTGDVDKRLIRKQAEARLRFESQALVDKSFEGPMVDVGNRRVSKKAAQVIQDDLNKKYGLSSTVKYRDGKNYPIEAYMDGRVKTTEAEVSRVVNSMGAAATGVMTLKVSDHKAKDSCVYHENEIIFANDSMKAKFQEQFPDIDVSKWRTLQDLETDQTHIFKFNCKHMAQPYPIQFYDPANMAKAIKSNPIRKIPEKINEYQLNRVLHGR